MGKPFLVGRLVRKNLRRRPIDAFLTVVAIAAATTTLTLALSLYGVASHPYLATRAATAGPDVVAMPNYSNTFVPSKTPAAGLRAITSLIHAPGVVGHAGPFPVSFPTMRFHGLTVVAIAEGRRATRSPIDQPYVTNGSWLTAGGVVVERGFADELGIVPGDDISLNGRRFTVSGLAVTAEVPPYPQTTNTVEIDPTVFVSNQDIGLVWLSEPQARSLATPSVPATYILDLKLSDPASAEAFEFARANDEAITLTSWIDINQTVGEYFLPIQRALLIMSWLLGLLAIASMAVIVGARTADQTRRVGRIKAVGGTPAFTAVSLLAEYLLLACTAAAVGLGLGWVMAPLVDRPGASLVGSAGAPSVSTATFGWALCLAMAVAVIAATVPALRAARVSTTTALADAAHLPRRSPMLVSLASRLPVPLLLGVRLAARRPRRMVLTAFSLAVTVTTIVAVLTVHSHQAVAGQPVFGYSSLLNPKRGRVDEILFVMTIVLGILAAVNALVITWATSVDSRGALAVSRALGASPSEVRVGLVTALLLPALPGVVAGLPLGVLLVVAVSHGSQISVPPAWWMAVTFLGVLGALAALAAVPARMESRRPVAEVLQAELA